MKVCIIGSGRPPAALLEKLEQKGVIIVSGEDTEVGYLDIPDNLTVMPPAPLPIIPIAHLEDHPLVFKASHKDKPWYDQPKKRKRRK